ncbi:MAG: AsmA-like C-terminal domain-containing protein, partial [Mariprofundaceae bacterium]
KALPSALPETTGIQSSKWVLRSKATLFEWDDAKIYDADIQLASAQNSHGVFRAKKATSGDLSLQNIDAMFALMGEGHIELRRVSAFMDEQHLSISGTLKPTALGSMQWQGYAILKGNFGQLMKRAELSQLFEDGNMNLLFSGQGILLRNQPWWQGLKGRLRLRVDDGRIMKGGTLSKLLAAISILDLPKILIAQRDDLTKTGLVYRRMQIEATLKEQDMKIQRFALRSSAMDAAGKGHMDIHKGLIDMIMVVKPFQNLDALLSVLPIIRDLIGGRAHSLLRKIYHMHGPIADAKIDSISAEEAGLASSGLIENFLSLPDIWFGNTQTGKP